jgi:16S rRNA (adenine1518-N6/adenine1519-N6)-dimethyltransferase
MPQSKHEIQSLLASANTQPRHRFGQNFMIDQNLVRVIAGAATLTAGPPADLVIEVGPGTGTLTDELLSRGVDVVAVEIDRDLARLLRQRLENEPRFQLIEGDALSSKHALNEQLVETINAARGRPIKLVANLPYNIASPLIIELLIFGIDMLVFTVQKEVADRLRAAPGSDAYGPLSVMAQLLARVEVLRTLPPQAFWPPPKIDSALVRMTRDDKSGGNAAAFGRFVQKLFSFRRKTLRKALAQAGHDADAAIAATRLDPQARPEVLSVPQLQALFAATSASPAPASSPAPAPAPPE